ncbi:relaxase/mobilization nuclease domain protein [mine drainage metagenome]|uniref:Relaxase/mobilization nuclease domain protein n=1 Tax=mine drainage metagenome TaxID=410659 RepID=A0A1J5RVW9_9ZZZZ
MVAVIHTSSSFHVALNYNEQKVKQQKANCIMAMNYPKDLEQLNFYQKLTRLTKQASLNENTKRNSLHISLNFDPSEKLEREKMEAIAEEYMNKIGFGKQPYLVYQHHDAGHPHLHIITTNIQRDGKRISLHNIGRNESTKARKEIEIKYKLIKADDKKLKQVQDIQPVLAAKIQYGKSETKRSISNVLSAVIDQYKYTSLAELNALLKLYNVTADPGEENSRIFTKHGLMYRVLDEKGNKIGMPIKASSFYNKPTLLHLEKKFSENKMLREVHKKHLKNTIDWIMIKPLKTLEQFKEALQKEKISVVIRKNEEGIIYGLTYIDHHTKSVFNGSDIGKAYAAKMILEKYRQSQSILLKNTITDQQGSPVVEKNQLHLLNQEHNPGTNNLLDIIITPAEEYSYVPAALKKRKKKKQHRPS